MSDEKCVMQTAFEGRRLTCVYRWGHAGNHGGDGFRWSPEENDKYPVAGPQTVLNKLGVPELGMLSDAEGTCLKCGALLGSRKECFACHAYAAGRARGIADGKRAENLRLLRAVAAVIGDGSLGDGQKLGRIADAIAKETEK